MKIISLIMIGIVLIGTVACSGTTTTIINNTTVIPTSTINTKSTTTTHSELVAEANSELAAIMTANQAYSAENGGEFAPNSNKLLSYLTNLPDAIYFFNENTGIITSVM